MKLEGSFHRATGSLFFWGGVVLLMLMTVVISIDAIGRYVFNSPLEGAQDIVGVSLFTLFLIILPHSFFGDYQIRMDLFYARMPGWVRTVADLVGAAGALVLATVLAWQAWENIPMFYVNHAGTLNVKIPYWPFNVVMLGTGVLLLVSVLLCVATGARAGDKGSH
ncbi:MAG: TRAP transporter small permease [Alphaproteobacteria bacterium]|nr:TRAP transporter small permease [Alphaproteobacteria bacterium]